MKYLKNVRLRGSSSSALASHRWGPEFEFRSLLVGFMGVETESRQVFLRSVPFSPVTNFIPPFLHTRLIHFVTLPFIRACDGASGVVGRHPF